MSEKKCPFSTFVNIDNPTNIEELTAYSLYKAGKLQFELDLENEDLTPAEYKQRIETYTTIHTRDDEVERLRVAASSLVQDYAEHYQNKAFIRKFIFNVFTSIVASGIVAFISFAFYLKKISSEDFITNVYNKYIEKHFEEISKQTEQSRSQSE